MSTLCVIDVSAVVYTGVYSPRYAKLTSFGYPTGGINFFMNQLMVAVYEFSDIVLCFDSPNFRKKLLPEYKSGRSHNSAAISQIESLFEYLSQCGFSCCKYDGYEADDIIDWVIEQNYKKYSNIIIVGNDKDLAHSIRPNVCFRSCRSDMNIIRKTSFPDAVIKDVSIPYNMVSVYKCLCGCKSDSVPAFQCDTGQKGMTLFNHAVKFYEKCGWTDDYDASTNPHSLLTWAQACEFTDDEYDRLEKRIELIYPAECPYDEQIPVSHYNDIDFDKLSTVLTMFNVADLLRGRYVYRKQLNDDEKQEMYTLARNFTSGAFNADKNIPMDSDRARETPLTLDMFQKDF